VGYWSSLQGSNALQSQPQKPCVPIYTFPSTSAKKMTDIQILSDLHLENPKACDTFKITPKAPYLALLGDIGCVRDPEFLDIFLPAQLVQFRVVLHVLGNHEPYDSDWDTVLEKLQRFAAAQEGRYVLLDRTEYTLPDQPDVTILGCTLFSQIPKEQAQAVSFGLNDFSAIDSWTVEEHDEMHARDLAWLNERIAAISRESPERQIAVFTHHSPTRDARAVDPRHVNSPIAAGFSTDLQGEPCWESKVVKLWAFGHTHFNCDYNDERTGKRVYTNQRRYYFQQSPGYRADAIVNLEESERL
jgi:hypothetical protein